MSSSPESGSGSADLKGGAASTGGREHRSESCLGKINRVINGNIELGFSKLGRFIGRRPILTILVVLVIAGGLTSGVTQIDNETRCATLSLAAPLRRVQALALPHGAPTMRSGAGGVTVKCSPGCAQANPLVSAWPF